MIFRSYQLEADEGISNALGDADSCVVKMFCGTGKSIVMRNCATNLDQRNI